ncbi:dipeptide ABC transporter ATP-binding protein [Taklimakanibacter lacteus]|uniref:dipeptide ABC transporter ATP-binding protein n=1 Tax=Taklimakanibacter lacteus TaxID=2268456 RepID=UPI0034D69962
MNAPATSSSPARSERETILAVEDLGIELVRGAERRAILDGVSFAVPERGLIGIIGESGSGKTVLGRALTGWVPEPLRQTRGSVAVAGRKLSQLTNEELRQLRGRTVGYIGSDPGTSFDPTLPIGVQIAQKLRAVVPHTGWAAAKKRVLDLLDQVRIPSAARRFDEYPYQFSGGMLQRAAIVDALVAQPKILICDNITQPLDVTIAAQIVRLLRGLERDLATAIVFFTSSVPVAKELIDDLIILDKGRIIERGPKDRVIARPAEAHTRRLIDSSPRIWGKDVDVPRNTTAAALPSDVLLSVEDVVKTYRVPDRTRFSGTLEVKAVRGVTLDIRAGENVGLVGESGCGKSTLSRLLSWIETPDRGHIRFQGKDMAGLRGKELLAMRRKFQLLLQDPYNCLPPHLSVAKTIRTSLDIHGVKRAEARERARAVMHEVGLKDDDAERLPIGMSAGQRQRVNIARALVLEPTLLILDETLSSLDPAEQSRLIDLFERLQAKHGLTYLVISHDLALVRKVCSRVAVMYLGKIVENAGNARIFDNPGNPYTRALLSAVPVLDKGPFNPAECLVDGEPPSPINVPKGCSFATRCPKAADLCRSSEPLFSTSEQNRNGVACHFPYH